MARPQGNQDLVLARIRAGLTSPADIIEATGLDKKAVWNAIYRLRQAKQIITKGRGPASTVAPAGKTRGIVVPHMRASAPPPVAASVEAPFRALMTHLGEIQVAKDGAVCTLGPGEALDLYRFLDSMEPILTAKVAEEVEA